MTMDSKPTSSKQHKNMYAESSKRKKYPDTSDLKMPDNFNPFAHRLDFQWYDYLQIAIMSVTIAPIRLLFFFLLFCLAGFISYFSVIAVPAKDLGKPFNDWRRWFLIPLLAKICRVWYFFLGFLKVKVVGQMAPTREAPILVFAPHSSYMDVIAMAICNGPSVLSRYENRAIPIIGKVTDVLQPVYVERYDPDSRSEAVNTIRARALSGNWPQIGVFPEGTCSNGKSLITFKGGAFYPGLPVQPVCIRYPNRKDTFTWTWDGPSGLLLLWLTLCQFYNNVEIRFLPVYNPSREEIDDPLLFAHNVRAVMARAMGIGVSDQSYDDYRKLVGKNAYLRGLMDNLEVQVASLNLSEDKIEEIANGFDDKTSCDIRDVELLELMHLPDNADIRGLYDLFKKSDVDPADLREFLFLMTLYFDRRRVEHAFQLAFRLWDRENTGKLFEPQVRQIMSCLKGFPSDFSIKKAGYDTDSISYDQFLDCFMIGCGGAEA